MIRLLNWLLWRPPITYIDSDEMENKQTLKAVKVIERFYLNIIKDRKMKKINEENINTIIADFKDTLPTEKKTEKKTYNRKRQRVYKEGKMD